MSNTINIVFDGGTTLKTDPLYQFDTGQILAFTDLTLPDTYEVHFGNTMDSGTAIPVVATSAQVAIPDSVLANGHTVFVWVYIDGITTHMITIPVRRRPRPENLVVSESEANTITTLISQMQSALETIEGYVETVESLVSQAQEIVDEAEGLTATVDSDGYINIG